MSELIRLIIAMIIAGTIGIAIIGVTIYIGIKLIKKRKDQIELSRKINTENYLNLKKIAKYVEEEQNKKD